MHLVLHFGIHEYVCAITQNALTLQLLGAVLPVPTDPFVSPTEIFWIATVWTFKLRTLAPKNYHRGPDPNPNAKL